MIACGVAKVPLCLPGKSLSKIFSENVTRVANPSLVLLIISEEFGETRLRIGSEVIGCPFTMLRISQSIVMIGQCINPRRFMRRESAKWCLYRAGRACQSSRTAQGACPRPTGRRGPSPRE